MASIRFTEAEYADLMARRGKSGKANNRDELQPPQLECGKAHALAPREKAQQVSQRFSVRCNVKGWKPRDCDRIYIAPLLDALTACGIWPDDKNEFVKEVCFAAEIVKGEPDETIIIIEEIPEVP